MISPSDVRMRDTILRAEGVSKAFDPAVPILEDVHLVVKAGEFLSIAGPSGCGKTTLLRCLAGLLPPDKGRVLQRDEPINGPPPWLSIVFQDYTRSLFPWLTVERNVAFGLSKVPRAEAKQRARDALGAVGLGDISDLYPWQLSGGMQQRVALARAIAAQPELLLLDEPFASVDAQTRMELQDLVLTLARKRGFSVLLVTHDVDEAVYMSDRVVVLSMRPATPVAEIEVDLPYPRDQLATKESQAFLERRHAVFSAVRAQARMRTTLSEWE